MYVNSTGIKYKWKRNSSEKMIQIVIHEKKCIPVLCTCAFRPQNNGEVFSNDLHSTAPPGAQGKSARQIPKESYLTNIFVIGIGVDFSAV